MKHSNLLKLRLIAFLMVATLIVLLFFSIQWLRSQYAEQKTSLQESFKRIYLNTYYDIMEKKVKFGDFTMTIGDTNTHKYTIIQNHQTTYVTFDSAKSKGHITVEKGDSAGNNIKKLMSYILMRTLVDSKKKDSLNDCANTCITPDSLLVRQKFISSLKQNNITVVASWKKDGDSWAIRLDDSKPEPTVFISHYSFYLIKKIIPQILFTLLLFIVCCFAFILSYTTLKKQYRLNLQKDDFINNMSHELQTPVATATVAIEALQNFDAMNDMQKRKDYLEMAAWEMNRLGKLVTNMISNIQMENGSINMLKKTLDINNLLQSLSDNMQPLFKEKQKTITYSSASKNITVNADAVHLEGAIYNILDNAIKYGGNHVTLNLKPNGETCIITIRDNGKGIPDEYKKKVFDKFFRIPSGNIHNIKGQGLGLSYTRFVIKSHGGEIKQENNSQGGADFIITLPIQA